MDDINKENPTTDKTHRRKGSALEMLGHVYRDVREFLFQNDFIIRNRPGRAIDTTVSTTETGRVKTKSMLEMFFGEPSSQSKGINAITIGRQGDGKFRNTNLIQLEANYDSEIGTTAGYQNGVIRARVSKDGSDERDRSGLYIMHAGTEVEGREGVIAQLVGAGPRGEVRLTYMENLDEEIGGGRYSLYVSPSGIHLYRGFITMLRIEGDHVVMPNLPKVSPGGTGRLWNDNGTVKIT